MRILRKAVITDMRYVQVYFSQMDDADDILRTIHDKTDDSVVWHCPTAEGINRAVAALAEYDSDNLEVRDESSSNYPDAPYSGAWNERVEYGNSVYILTYHVGLGYVGLEREVSDDYQTANVSQAL